MERALSVELLGSALGDQQGVPTAEELQARLAEAEIALFLRRSDVPPDLLNTAWFLHAVASVDRAHELYTVARQRQAFAVSAHIFDLALGEARWSRADRLTLGFAAAIGYRRGELDPNAAAIVRRLQQDFQTDAPVLDHIHTVAVEAGLLLLGFDTRSLFGVLRRWCGQLRDVGILVGLDGDLRTTGFGTTQAAVRGADHLLQYLARGDRGRLDQAFSDLTMAADGAAGPLEHEARWVAVHLLALAGEADAGSVFTLLPPELPTAARSAFTMASPAVVTLWRPQRELLTGPLSPLAASTRRIVLSVPTSGGKTLIAQMMTVAHLAQQNTSVCYVAPTRSLCREVRRALATRVRILQKEVAVEAPDFPVDAFANLGDLLDAFDDVGGPPEVEVMTPERLSHLIRHDPVGVLSRFGLFIFDEAQHLQERGRGFTLESLISFLHHRTRDSDHRLVLISAALGNAGQVMQWIDPRDEGLLHSSDWRGPRRLHAMISSEPDWNKGDVTQVRGRKFPYRMKYPVHGTIRLRPADNRPTRSLRTIEPIGEVTLKAKSATQTTGRTRDADRSTANYVLAASMITVLGHAGSVLVVAGQRVTAERLAKQLATELPEHPATFALADFARRQLGDAHPLVATLRHGVGFHHAGLPTEVLEAVEDALRADHLPYLTCTSTLTDGINLPVRTVVIYDETHLPDSRLTGARLVNAMGRAGRAGKESEGWIVLMRTGGLDEADFEDMRPTDEDLKAWSTLASPDALTEIAELEQAAREQHDALFTAAAGAAADFVAFLWFVLSAEETSGLDPEELNLDDVLDGTLAARQISEVERRRWSSAAQTIRETYLATEPTTRQRWSRAGTSLGSARALDELAQRVHQALRTRDHIQLGELSQPGPVLHLFTELWIVRDLLALPEAPRAWRFRTTPAGADIDVPPEIVLQRWIAGASLQQIADELLTEAADPAWRISQLVDAVTAHFEHYLSWTFGALLDVINTGIEEPDVALCPELAGYIRYGVDTRRGLTLTLAGIRSRRLVHALVAQLPGDLAEEDVAAWLGALTLREWRDRFEASASEVIDLLDFTRSRRGSMLRPLLEAGETSCPLRLEEPQPESILELSGLTIGPVQDGPAPHALGVFAGTQLLGVVPPTFHSDVAAVLDTGLEVIPSLQPDGYGGLLLHLILAV